MRVSISSSRSDLEITLEGLICSFGQKDASIFVQRVGIPCVGWTKCLRVMQLFCSVFDLEVQNISCRMGRYSAKVPLDFLISMNVFLNPTKDPQPPKIIWCHHKHMLTTSDSLYIDGNYRVMTLLSPW